MDCVHSMAPSDEDLLQLALDGEALKAEKMAHLAQCSICQERLTGYRTLQTLLVSRLYRRLCPSGSTLSYYCADLLPGEQKLTVAMHIRDCPRCAEEVGQTRAFMAMPLISVKTSARSRLAVKRIFGTLVRQQAQLVLRSDPTSEPTSWPRQYRAETLDLSLHLSRASDGGYVLLGIMTSIDSTENVDAFEGTQAELQRAPEQIGQKEQNPSETAVDAGLPVLHTAVDDLGNIVFNAVPAGEYILVVYLPDREVVIEGLVVEAGKTTKRNSPS